MKGIDNLYKFLTRGTILMLEGLIYPVFLMDYSLCYLSDLIKSVCQEKLKKCSKHVKKYPLI